jgi:hypothetical protein
MWVKDMSESLGSAQHQVKHGLVISPALVLKVFAGSRGTCAELSQHWVMRSREDGTGGDRKKRICMRGYKAGNRTPPPCLAQV